MRLLNLYIDGFGHFHDRTIGPLDPGMSVLYGANEAGKSTLLAFIRTILFGFPSRGRRDFYPAIAGGRHGGLIPLSDDDGSVYTLGRFEGPRGGPYALRTDSGEVLSDPAVLQRITGQVTLDLFSNIFAFSLDEMQSGGLMNDEEVSGRLYSAGIGASALPDFTRALRGRRERLFKTGGSAQQISRLLRDLNGIDDQLRDIRENSERYRRLTERQGAISVDLAELDSEISDIAAGRAETGRLLQGWEDWMALEALEARLLEMPQFERFPESAVERLEEFQSRIRAADDDRKEAEERLRKTSEAADQEIPGEALLADAESIEAIRRARSSFDDSVGDLPERQQELKVMEDDLSQRLRLLGQGWDEDGLNGVNTSLEVRQRAEGWRDKLNRDSRVVEAARIRLQENQDRLGELQDEQRTVQQRLQTDSSEGGLGGLQPPGGNLEEVLTDKEEIEQIRRGRGSFDDSVRDLPERRAELGAQEEDIKKRLRDLGQGWDEARLDAFDTSIVFRQEAESWRDTLGTSGEQVRRDTERLERERSDQIDRQSAVEQARAAVPEEVPTLDATELEVRRNALRAARSRLGEYTGILNNLENLRGQLASLSSSRSSGAAAPEGRPLLAASGLGILGAALIVLGALLGQEALFIGVVGGLALIGVAAYLLLRTRGSRPAAESPLAGGVEENIRRTEKAAAETRRLLAEAAQPLELNEEPTANVLDAAEAMLESATRALAELESANQRLHGAESALEAQQRRVDGSSTRVDSALQDKAESADEWKEWLARHGLPEGFAPETVIDFAGRVDIGREVLGGMRRMQQRVSAIEVDIDEYTDLVRPLALRYGLSFEDGNHQGVIAVADRLIESFDQVRQIVARRDDTSRRVAQQEQAEVSASSEHEQTQKVLSDSKDEYGAWLGEHGFDAALAPEALLEFLARAEPAQGASLGTWRMRDRVVAIEVDIDEFRAQVMPLAETHGIMLDSTDLGLLAEAADSLIGRLEEARALLNVREQERKLKLQQEETLQRLQQRLTEAEGELSEFLQFAGAQDEEDLRSRAREHEIRLRLQAQVDERELSLASLSGPGERLAAFRESLASFEHEQLTERMELLGEWIEDAGVRREALRDERAENAVALEQLAGEEESSALRIERNILVEQLQDMAREWSRLTIGGEILRRTQQKFEQERQPSVIRHAEEFFGNVTGNRYQRLFAPIGQQTITVIDEVGRDKSAPQLSRGTREQLYLALRFGLIREFGEHAERLPIIVDEALVNFDAERAGLAAGAFAKLSDTNQVLVFTCHRNIAEMFADVGARVIEIGQQDAT